MDAPTERRAPHHSPRDLVRPPIISRAMVDHVDGAAVAIAEGAGPSAGPLSRVPTEGNVTQHYEAIIENLRTTVAQANVNRQKAGKSSKQQQPNVKNSSVSGFRGVAQKSANSFSAAIYVTALQKVRARTPTLALSHPWIRAGPRDEAVPLAGFTMFLGGGGARGVVAPRFSSHLTHPPASPRILPSRLTLDPQQVVLGTFPTKELAAQMYDAAAEVLFGDSGMFNLPAPAGGAPRRAPTTQEVAAAKLAAVPEGNVKRAKCQTCGQLLPVTARKCCVCFTVLRVDQAGYKGVRTRPKTEKGLQTKYQAVYCIGSVPQYVGTFHTAEAAARAYDAKAREVLGEEAAKKPGVTNFSSVEEADAKVEAAEAKLRAEGIPLDPIKTKQRSNKKRETPGGVVWKDGHDAPPVSPANAGGKKAGKKRGGDVRGEKKKRKTNTIGEGNVAGAGAEVIGSGGYAAAPGAGRFGDAGGFAYAEAAPGPAAGVLDIPPLTDAQAKKNGGKNTIAQLLGDGF